MICLNTLYCTESHGSQNGRPEPVDKYDRRRPEFPCHDVQDEVRLEKKHVLSMRIREFRHPALEFRFPLFSFPEALISSKPFNGKRALGDSETYISKIRNE